MKDALFDPPAQRIPAGRVRIGLDADIKAAEGTGQHLSKAGIASLRGLAGQLDELERWLRRPNVKPYDRVPLATLQKQFDDTYDRVFTAAADVDSFETALRDFRAAEAGDTEDHVAPD